MNTTQVLDLQSTTGFDAYASAGRPFKRNRRNGQVLIKNARGTVMNSQLRKDEWEELEAVVMEAVKYELRLVNDLKAAGLVHPVGIGTLVSTWNTSSRMTAASVSMTGQSLGERDRVEYDVEGSPIPVIFKEFALDARQLAASRALGSGIDLTHVYEATRSMAETLEDIMANGHAVKFQNNSLYGYTNAPNRLTDTATNYGGGAWSTATNIVPTIAGMVNAANTYHFYGPFVLYVSQGQYNEAALSFFADGSGDRPMDRIQKLGVAQVRNLPAEILPDGELLLVQMQRNVVDWAEAFPVQVYEWSAEDGMSTMFKLMTIAAPRIKTASNSKTGIVHATGA